MSGKPEELLVHCLKEKGLTITTVESLTAGMIASALADVPGASAVLREAYVTYCDEAKHKLAGVSEETLRKYTAVSRQTACEMAEGICRAAEADIAVSATGIAGPDGGTEACPVGTVWTGCCFHGKTRAEHHLFTGSRKEIRQQSVTAALKLALEMLAEDRTE